MLPPKFLMKFSLAALIVSLLFINIQAQSETPRIEFGVHYSRLSLDDVDLLYDDSQNNGIGGRVTFNANHWLSFEGEFTHFRKGGFPGNRSVGLFGGKFGFRSERIGIFAKVRPGFLRFGNNLLPFTGQVGGCAGVNQYNPALDVGGVLEFYPTYHTMVRVDGGDTIARITRQCPFPGDHEFITHNPQINVGFGFRF